MAYSGTLARNELGCITYCSRTANECEIQSITIKDKGIGNGAKLTCFALKQCPLSVHTVWGMGRPNAPVVAWAKQLGSMRCNIPFFYGQALEDYGVLTYKKIIRYLLAGTDELADPLEAALQPNYIYDSALPIGEQLKNIHYVIATPDFKLPDDTKVIRYDNAQFVDMQTKYTGDWATALTTELCVKEGW